MGYDDGQLRRFVHDKLAPLRGEEPPPGPPTLDDRQAAGQGTGARFFDPPLPPAEADDETLEDVAEEADGDDSGEDALAGFGVDEIAGEFPPLHRQAGLVRSMLEDPPAHGFADEDEARAWIHWASTTTAAEWEAACRESGWPVEDRPGTTDFPIELQVDRLRSNLEQRAADIAAGRRPPL